MNFIDRPFACHHCNARFTRKEHKTRHEQIHSSRQQFVCRHCSRLFQRKDVLLRHERLVHKIGNPSNHLKNLRSRTAVSELCDGHLEQVIAGNDLSFQEPIETAQSSWCGQQSSGTGSRAGADEQLSPSNGAMVLSPMSLGLGEWSADSQHHEVLQHPEIESLAFSFPYPTPVPTINPSKRGDDITLSANGIGQYCDEFGFLDVGPSHFVLQPTGPSEPRLLEKLLWLAEGQSKPIPDIELEKVWTAVRHCLAELSVSVSRNMMQRNLRYYFTFFHPHAAIIHTPTFRASTCHHALLLAMAAIGATYSHDRNQARKLYEAASYSLEINQGDMARTTSLQTLLLLTIYACWSDRPEMQQQCSTLSSRIRIYLGTQADLVQSSSCSEWHRWIEAECLKRTVCFSYWFLSVLRVSTKTMANTIRDQGISLELPYEESFWQCEDEIQWLTTRPSVPTPPTFANAFEILLSPEKAVPANVSLFGLAVLMCGLLSQVEHITAIASSASSQTAKTLLQSCDDAMGKWESTIQATVSRYSKTGGENFSMAHASIAMWHMTMMHLQADVGIVEIAQFIVSSPDEENLSQLVRAAPRSLQMSKAMRHAVECLRGPVSVGINFLARTGCGNVNPCLSRLGFHVVILLAQWLRTLEATMIVETRAVLTAEELDVMEIVQGIVSDSGVPELENLGLPLSESCLKIWNEALGPERLTWDFDENKRQILRPDVLF
ncbi:unnamed protein product [Fusarium graminearum]|uniref:C2H2-type domain-containing protein n=1 Tax=Gibberella zeae TaxID=5518 RepID=A0A4E9EDV6_GIBZA|nr:unnamed protein product [Fusarium graminearum]